MVRNRGKKALYEVMGKVLSKPRVDKGLGQPVQQGGEGPVGVEEQGPKIPSGIAKWPKKPRAVQLNLDRIEISIPYQVAIAVLLGFILLILVVFRLGQLSQREGAEAAAPEAAVTKPVKIEAPAAPVRVVEKRRAPAAVETGNNRIVIQTYQLRSHLEPVRQYFAQFGIGTEIRKIDNWYYLVTSEKYDNPEKPGTNGYAAKQRIIELGANYKAPQGYESFGTRPFHDAYGKRFED